MRKTKIGATLLAGIALVVLVFGGAFSAAIGFASAQDGHATQCWKHEGGDRLSNAHGYTVHQYNDDGTIAQENAGVVLRPYGADWWGDHYESLTIKGGPETISIDHPRPGVTYWAPWNPNSGKHYEVSNWTVCKGEDPPPPTTTIATTTTVVTTTVVDTTLPETTTTTEVEPSTTTTVPGTTSPTSTFPSPTTTESIPSTSTVPTSSTDPEPSSSSSVSPPTTETVSSPPSSDQTVLPTQDIGTPPDPVVATEPEVGELPQTGAGAVFIALAITALAAGIIALTISKVRQGNS